MLAEDITLGRHILAGFAALFAGAGAFATKKGGYIATETAFSSVNFAFLPSVVSSMWPTVIWTPLIFLLVCRYRTQVNRLTASSRAAVCPELILLRMDRHREHLVSSLTDVWLSGARIGQ